MLRITRIGIFFIFVHTVLALNVNDFDWLKFNSKGKHTNSKKVSTSHIGNSSQPLANHTSNYCAILYKIEGICLEQNYFIPDPTNVYLSVKSSNRAISSSPSSGVNSGQAYQILNPNPDNSQQVGVQRALGGAAAQALLNNSAPLNNIDILINIDSNTSLKLNQQQIQLDVKY